jgi:hypothetical protein
MPRIEKGSIHHLRHTTASRNAAKQRRKEILSSPDAYLRVIKTAQNSRQIVTSTSIVLSMFQKDVPELKEPVPVVHTPEIPAILRYTRSLFSSLVDSVKATSQPESAHLLDLRRM